MATNALGAPSINWDEKVVSWINHINKIQGTTKLTFFQFIRDMIGVTAIVFNPLKILLIRLIIVINITYIKSR
ncbi:hypothetical protein BB987_11895 [Photorhabdus temperata]|uniref:Uncharacterized protein n=1 Tax=Photorhabdus khanii subsp. guanajuatensis TaxID=2100166 RepID=A0A4R4J6S3_9GAMM|nr:hypothetical protein BB987_11895 [Photorhabdus temperata]TDB49334.1 hypothetical protein C5467_17430 [Photorhabdus khanii subsp. guanajuatensis]